MGLGEGEGTGAGDGFGVGDGAGAEVGIGAGAGLTGGAEQPASTARRSSIEKAEITPCLAVTFFLSSREVSPDVSYYAFGFATH